MPNSSHHVDRLEALAFSVSYLLRFFLVLHQLYYISIVLFHVHSFTISINAFSVIIFEFISAREEAPNIHEVIV